MKIYAFYNNKGGTGKTSLIFQTVLKYAALNPDKQILAVDACPQANFTELLLGGLENNGSSNLSRLQSQSPRRTIGGYFQDRFNSPYQIPPSINFGNYISQPRQFNSNVGGNIDLIAGDQILELQSNAIATLSNNQIPGTNPWLSVIDWLKNLIDASSKTYDAVFIDTNPAFTMFTQIAISASDHLVVPVMADDSSRRALSNVFSLVYGLSTPTMYNQYLFSTKLANAGRALPKIACVIKNRLTQYMGPASAYTAVLSSIDQIIQNNLSSSPHIFAKSNFPDLVCEVRDFQTTGVVAYAHAMSFDQCQARRYTIQGDTTQLKREYIDNCIASIESIVRSI